MLATQECFCHWLKAHTKASAAVGGNNGAGLHACVAPKQQSANRVRHQPWHTSTARVTLTWRQRRGTFEAKMQCLVPRSLSKCIVPQGLARKGQKLEKCAARNQTTVVVPQTVRLVGANRHLATSPSFSCRNRRAAVVQNADGWDHQTWAGDLLPPCRRLEELCRARRRRLPSTWWNLRAVLMPLHKILMADTTRNGEVAFPALQKAWRNPSHAVSASGTKNQKYARHQRVLHAHTGG